jgi:hypothetical protein
MWEERDTTHLERHTRFDLVCKHLRDGFVEVDEDLHSQLRLDAALRDEQVERVCQGLAETM